MRAIWRGAISFGLVHIPVRVFTSTEEKDISFRQLHRTCVTPVRYLRHCPKCNREVRNEEIARGFEYTPGHFVIMEDEEVESAAGGRDRTQDRTVEILDFVDLKSVDPIYFAKSYYLEPAEGGYKAYALLRRAMQQTGRTAVARITLRRKENLALIRVYEEEVLMMATLFDPDEIRDYRQLDLSGRAVDISDRELDVARELIDRLTMPFEPERYEDRTRKKLQQAIEAKIGGADDHVVQGEPKAPVIDLMEALQASVREAGGREKENGRQRLNPSRTGSER